MRTLYDELGLGPNAKPHEIGLAWQRYQAEQQKESTMPDPRRKARVQQAYETLSDPKRRAEYDASLIERPEEGRPDRRFTVLVVAALGVVVLVGVAGYFLARGSGPKSKPSADVALAAGLHVAALQGALPSGEVKELGLAVDVRADRMAIPCRGFEANMVLTAKQAGTSLRGELLQANEAVGICILNVKGASEGVVLREGLPAQGETLYVVFPGATDARTVAAGPPVPGVADAFSIPTSPNLPNGAPLFDGQGRLVGQVVVPHEKGTTFTVVLGANRVKQVRPEP